MYSFLATHILAPALDFSRGTRTMRCLKEFERSQWWPRDRILELQNQGLRLLLEHAYKTVPYYQRIFSERDIKPDDIVYNEDLTKLPILTKRLIRDNFKDMVSRGFPIKEIITRSTSGSTGEPLVFYRTRGDRMSWNFAASYRGYAWAGYKLGDKLAGFSQVIPASSMRERISESVRYFFERIMVVDASMVSDETGPDIVRKVCDFQPRFLRGYPSAIYLLARFIEKTGQYKNRIKPRAIFTGAEVLYDYQRELFRKVFECEAYSHYCSFELHPIAVECPTHSGHHITAENVFVEIVDDDGEAVPADREGRILITNLHSYAMPFIRYDIGDVGALSKQVCSCGRGLPLLSRLSGRTDDVLVTRGGRHIPGTGLQRKFLAFLGIEHCQIIQDNYENLTVKLVLDRPYPQEHMDKISREILSRYRPILGADMNITVEFVDRIPLTRSGKQRVVISKIKHSK